MLIEINDTKTLADIRQEFSALYPFLTIEFYDKPHIWQEASSQKHQLPHDKTIGEIRKRHNPGAVEIQPWIKTGEVELAFQKHFGLHVQVLRHHGDTWVQAVGTDMLTLEEQNEIGRAASLGHSNRAGSKNETDNPL